MPARFRDLQLGETFDWVSGTSNDSYYEPCIKIGKRTYRAIRFDHPLQVGTIDAFVYHVGEYSVRELDDSLTADLRSQLWDYNNKEKIGMPTTYENVEGGAELPGRKSTGEDQIDRINAQIEAEERYRKAKEQMAVSSLRMTDDASKAVQKTPNRVSLDSILAKIADEQYIYPRAIEHMTICVLVLENGFAVVGHAAPADPENFNEELGQKFAKEDAIRQIWPLEAYLLREKLSKEE